MKRLIPLLLALMLLTSLCVPALADVAYVPRNDFLERHTNECRYENRAYYTNGPSGYAMLWDSPKGAPQTALPNGELYYVSWVYPGSDGSWGCVTLTDQANGWVKLAEMLPDYDYRAFDADHSSEYDNSERTLKAEPGKEIQLYKYPGSGEVVSVLDTNWLGDEGGEISFNQLFTDPAGRVWGFLGYLFGHREAWICLDDPYNAALEPDENCVKLTFAQPDVASPQTSTIDDTKKLVITAPASEETIDAANKAAQKTGLGSLIGAGGVVVIALAVLVEVLRRKRMRKY